MLTTYELIKLFLNKVYHADCRQWLKNLPDNSVDLILTDVPYNLAKQPKILDVVEAFQAGQSYTGRKGFMGRAWDSFIPGPDFTNEFYRVLKPGGLFISSMSPRTDYILKLSLEFAGFDIKESWFWLYGSDFPKSKGRIKHMAEVFVVARKPIKGTIKANVKQWGCGVFDTEAGRIGESGGTKGVSTGNTPNRTGNGFQFEGNTVQQLNKGRHPNNVFLGHAPGCVFKGRVRVKARSDDVKEAERKEEGATYHMSERPNYKRPVDEDGMETVESWQCVEGCPVREIGIMGGGVSSSRPGNMKNFNSKEHHNASSIVMQIKNRDFTAYPKDVGTVARYYYNSPGDAPNYFYAGKAVKCRHLGLKDFYWAVDDTAAVGYTRISKGEYEKLKAEFKRDVKEFKRLEAAGEALPKKPKNPVRHGNIHPTVKPLDLLEQVLKLATPKDKTKAVVVDPFGGSGGVAIACQHLGIPFISIDINAEYVDIQNARLAYLAHLIGKGTLKQVLEYLSIKQKPLEIETNEGVYKQKELF
jgi:DNA modification methylase